MLTMSIPPPAPYRRSAFQVALLLFATGGLYIFVWAYHARRYCSGMLEKQDQPLWKSIALVVPVFNLFLIYDLGLLIRSVALRANPHQRVSLLPWLGLLYFVIGATWRLHDPYWFVSLLDFIPITILQFFLMDAEFKLSGLDARPTRFHWVEWLVVTLGTALWLFAVAGTLIANEDGTVAQPAWLPGALLATCAAALVVIGTASRRATRTLLERILG